MAVSSTHECVCLRVCACVDSNPGLVIAIVFIVALCLLAVVATVYAPSCLVTSTSAPTPRLPVSFCLSPSTSPSSLLLSAPRFSQFFYMYLCLCTSTRTSPCLPVCLSVCLLVSPRDSVCVRLSAPVCLAVVAAVVLVRRRREQQQRKGSLAVSSSLTYLLAYLLC